MFSVASRLVAEPSVSSPDARFDQSNRSVIDRLADYCESLGFRVTLQDLPGDKRNLIAVLGDGPGGLVLSGHTDTVPFNEARWESDPFTLTERDGRLYGLGSADMKGFFAAALHAAQTFDAAQLKEPLVLIATADEESTMDGARALREMTLPSATRAIIGEPTGLAPVRMHKGILMEAVRLIGRSGHSSDPSLGVSALNGMSEVLRTLTDARHEMRSQRNEQFAVPEPTLNLGRIDGGDSPNRICSSCYLSFDVRFLPSMDAAATRDGLHARIRAAVSELGGSESDLVVEFETLAKAVPAFETAADASTVRVLEELSGQASKAVMFCTEAPFLQELGMETVVCGAGDIDVAHQPNEFVTPQGLQAASDLYAAAIQRFCVEPE